MRLVGMAAAVTLIAAPAWAQQGRGIAALQAMDMNHDGSITRAEAQVARGRMFDRLDADENGSLDRDERAALEVGPLADAVNGADVNNDGRVSRGELMGQPYRGFDRLDSNNDDIIQADEIERARIFLQGS